MTVRTIEIFSDKPVRTDYDDLSAWEGAAKMADHNGEDTVHRPYYHGVQYRKVFGKWSFVHKYSVESLERGTSREVD